MTATDDAIRRGADLAKQITFHTFYKARPADAAPFADLDEAGTSQPIAFLRVAGIIRTLGVLVGFTPPTTDVTFRLVHYSAGSPDPIAVFSLTSWTPGVPNFIVQLDVAAQANDVLVLNTVKVDPTPLPELVFYVTVEDS